MLAALRSLVGTLGETLLPRSFGSSAEFGPGSCGTEVLCLCKLSAKGHSYSLEAATFLGSSTVKAGSGGSGPPPVSNLSRLFHRHTSPTLSTSLLSHV